MNENNERVRRERRRRLLPNADAASNGKGRRVIKSEEPVAVEESKPQVVADEPVTSVNTDGLHFVPGVELVTFFQSLQPGKVYTIRTGGEACTVVVEDAVVVDLPKTKAARPSNGLRGKEYDEAVLTTDYAKWMEEWGKLSLQARIAKAKKMKVSWEAHVDEKIQNMRVTMAVQAALGIEKYKPAYADAAARRQLREG